MEFLYKQYKNMIGLLREKGYSFADYLNYSNFNKAVILRHDVDFSLEKALEMAEIEKKEEVQSNYFILLSTNFYNIFSKESCDIIKKIQSLGHNIGLHFDEKKYDITDKESMEFYITKEKEIFEEVLDMETQVVSMHRPSKWVLESDLQFEKILNTYSQEFFKNFKYVSDSRMHWREDVMEIIKEENFQRLHILTHPFWYSDKDEAMKEKLLHFIKEAEFERYRSLKDNFRDLDEVIEEEEVRCL